MGTWFEIVDVGSIRLWRVDENILMFAPLLLPLLWLLPAYANLRPDD